MKNKKLYIIVMAVLLAVVSLGSAVAVFSQTNAQTLSVYFYPLGNDADGDSCIITIGDVEILIDAGANKKSGPIIVNEMKEKISSDGKWDYIIATHADGDHIAGFTENDGVFSLFTGDKAQYTLGTLIDFDIVKDDTVKFEGKENLYTSSNYNANTEDAPDTQVYTDYAEKRDQLVKKGVTYYTAAQCCWDDRTDKYGKKPEGAKSEFDLGDGAKLHILYNYFYDHRIEGYEKNQISSADKNIISVCCLIEYGKHKFLFTGDLEEYDTAKKLSDKEGGGFRRICGESQLIKHKRNEDLLKDGVTFYKAGHHGSKSSSSKEFIDFIRPQYVVISCKAGGKKYNFPSQEAIDNIFSYTDKIYITSKYIDSPGNSSSYTGEDYYGKITFMSDGEDILVESEFECDSNNNPLPIYQTEWFKENRNDIFNIFTFSVASRYYSNCTLLKYGNIDILVDCGVFGSDAQSVELAKKVANRCVDGVIEYAIVTTAQHECVGGYFGSYDSRDSEGNCNSKSDGIFDLLEIGTLIEFGVTNLDAEKDRLPDTSPYIRYLEQKNEANEIAEKASPKTIVVPENNDISIEILDSKFYVSDGKTHKEDDYSVCVLVKFHDDEFLFTGDLTNKQNGESYLVKNNPQIDNVTFFRAANYGSKHSNSAAFIEYIAPKYIVVDCTPGRLMIEKGVTTMDKAVAKRFMANSNSEENVYITGDYKSGDATKTIGGDITFFVKTLNGNVLPENGMGIVNPEQEVLLRESAWYVKNCQ